MYPEVKDRKGRELQFEDILHYEKIIVALKCTTDLKTVIDKVLKLELVGVTR